ncbi:hypothetical protein [Ornithinibacillus halophilus]|uniref:Uncharacterized protein n=1 Tax=Ornithinibacillus halophilus TaxID=930117 RepID=A0A1M5NX25_9BACI|nr:hypothetical protein [Ornithinibacillus halophilus]SHG94047.1 hypothetical protein SAMN05216225_10922 [Ornithinibacillus halophilus]
MSEYKQDILNYGDDVNDFDSSPFESLRMLHDRTNIHMVQNKLEFEEKVLLGYYDLKLIENANKMVKRLRNVYDFKLSDENKIPHEQWWWHLNKIAEGMMDFGISTEKGKAI